MPDGAGRYSYSSSPDRTAASHANPTETKTAVPGQLIPSIKRRLSMSLSNGLVHGVAVLEKPWKLTCRELITRRRQDNFEYPLNSSRRALQDGDPIAKVDRLLDVVGDEDEAC